MQLLITSDSHGYAQSLVQALLAHPHAAAWIHLGDGARDVERAQAAFPALPLYAVCGNCDFYVPGMPSPANALLEKIGGRTVFMTHGHLYHVKSGLYDLCAAASARGAETVLFGHTHTPFYDFKDGLLALNPGAICDGAYATLDILPDKLLPALRRL